MPNVSRRTRVAGRALEDIIRDKKQGPANKETLILKIEARTGKLCPDWLFKNALHYARNFSSRRNDGYGPIIYDHFIDVYGYAGDAATFTYWALHFNLEYSQTRLNTGYQVGSEALMTVLNGTGMPVDPELRDIIVGTEANITTAAIAFEQAIMRGKEICPRGVSSLAQITHNQNTYVAIFSE